MYIFTVRKIPWYSKRKLKWKKVAKLSTIMLKGCQITKKNKKFPDRILQKSTKFPAAVKTSYFYFKGSKIQIFPDFWQLFLFLLSKIIQNDFPDYKMIEKWLASITIKFEWLLKAKTKKVVKNLWRFGFLIL